MKTEENMLILHTSDWHLGSEMDGRRRANECKALLQFIIKVIQSEHVDTLLVSGDIFDSHTPSNEATRQYYDFLSALCNARKENAVVENVVIIAGNHDSPSYLEAPSNLLKLMNIHVIGSIKEDELEREVIPLKKNKEIAAVVCAVPYLVSPGLPGKTQDEQDAAYEQYVVNHYRRVMDLAKEKYPGVPLISMGHFFAVGGKGSDDSILRGNLHGIHPEALPTDDVGYFALGHLHRPQIVNGMEKVRYAGSLLKMSFTEFDKDKEFVLWDTDEPDVFRTPSITVKDVPEICEMAVLEGKVEDLEKGLMELKTKHLQENRQKPLWVAVVNNGPFYPDLKNHLSLLLGEDSTVDIVVCKNQALNPQLASIAKSGRKLEEMTPEMLFDEFLKSVVRPTTEDGASPISEEDREWYKSMLRDVIRACEAEDNNDK
ncbi:MAG: exonuclease subunit SbcD [Victivallales bacterium]|nr:exonuclease subunit SbcD [Victivallales bacterium]